MVPSIFGENLFDEFWNDPFDMDRMLPRGRDPLYGKHSKNLMKTDVRETEGSYELDIDLPGFKKEEVNVELNNGYLTSRPPRASTRTMPTSRAATSGRSATRAR